MIRCEPVGEPGFFYKPSIVADVEPPDEVVWRESFGPLIAVQKFGSDEEGLRLTNRLPYGLPASVRSERMDRALDAARKLRFGTVWPNRHADPTSKVPHDGFKQSGCGKDLSAHAVEDYTVVKHVTAKLG